MKRLASAWMLVTFSAIAFIVRGDLASDNSLIDSSPLLVIVAMGGNVGLLTLWLIDQRIYQQLLSAVFEVGQDLERRHPELPPIRSMMWVNSGSRGVARYHALFYAVPMLLNSACVVYALGTSSSMNVAFIGSGAAAIFLLFIVLGDWFRSLGLERNLRAKSRSIEEVVDRWKEQGSIGHPGS